MKVISVNCVYGVGSTGKILKNLHSAMLSDGIESLVIYGRGEMVTDPAVTKISSEGEGKIHSAMSRLWGVDFGFSYFATSRLLKIIDAENPDVVHLHCLNGHFVNVYRLLDYLKYKRIPTVLTLHAELMHTAGCEHAFECAKWKTECHDCPSIHGIISHYFRDDARHCFRKIKACYDGFDNLTVVGVSDWLTDRARQSAVFGSKKPSFVTINNGVDADVFTYVDNNAKVKQRWNIPTGKTIIHVTPNFMHPIKGGKFVIELAKRMPNVNFVIVGYNGGKEIDLPENVVTIEHTNNQKELVELYSMADLTLLTSKRETFSMVCAESLCCGTPVLGFKAGGPESIALREYSSFVDYGDVDALEKGASEMLMAKYDKISISHQAMRQYSNNTMCQSYIDLYKSISKC